MIVIRTKRTVYRFQSRNANRDDYNNDSNVKFLLLRDWFANINWLKLKLQHNMFIIQTNCCFIKNKIRDLLCIRRFSIEIFNDYRISLINDLFVIFTIFEIRICEIFLITSFDAYIEICSLKSKHQCRAIVFSFLIWIVANRLFDSDLHRYNYDVERNTRDKRRCSNMNKNAHNKLIMTRAKKIVCRNDNDID